MKLGTSSADRRRRILLWVLSFMTMGALVSVSGSMDSVTCLVGLTCAPNPIVAIGNITLNNATSSAIGGVKVANSTGLNGFVSGWNATMSPIYSLPNETGQMIFVTVNTTDNTISATGNCYNVTMPANNFTTVDVHVVALMDSPIGVASDWNLSIGVAGVFYESMRATAGGVIGASFRIPLSVDHARPISTGSLIEVNGTENAGTGTMTCQKITVFGVR